MVLSEKPTDELKADLRAAREHLDSGLAALRAERKRRIRALEAELERRGEKLKPEAGRTPGKPVSKVYDARGWVQANEEGRTDENDLKMHEDKGDGTPLCGQPLRDWRGRKMVWVRHGPGPVNCGKCANISGAPTGSEPLVEPQGGSVPTVSGGGFETNRRRH